VNADDRRLIAAALAGNTAAFGDLVKRHQDRLFNAAVSRKRRKRPAASLDAARGSDPTLDPVDASVGARPGESMELREDVAELYAALARLSPEHRDVLVLKDLDGQRYEEIALVLGVPIGTVRSRLHRARMELRNLLDPDGA